MCARSSRTGTPTRPSADGQTAYFARGDGFFPQTRRATIMESRLVDGAWTEPTVVPFSGTYPDIDPWVAPDGESIYFSSIRPVGGEERTDVELWRVDRAPDPSLSPDGRTLYFVRRTGQGDLYETAWPE